MRARAFDALWIKDFGEGEENIRYEVTHLDARLAVIVFENWASGGGAHGFGGHQNLLFDWIQGRELKLSDIFSDPGTDVSAIAAQCMPLKKQAAEAGKEVDTESNVSPIVADVTKWAPNERGLDIMFDPYIIAGNVSLKCRLAYAELAKWLKPGGPLPPRN